MISLGSLYSAKKIAIFNGFKVIFTFIDQHAGLYVRASRRSAFIN